MLIIGIYYVVFERVVEFNANNWFRIYFAVT